MNGIISIRWGITGERPRALSLTAGIIGVLAGIGAISRRFVAPGEGDAIVVMALGAIILLTGILHVSEGFQRGTRSMAAPEASGLHHGRVWRSSWVLLLIARAYGARRPGLLAGQPLGAPGGDSPDRRRPGMRVPGTTRASRIWRHRTRDSQLVAIRKPLRQFPGSRYLSCPPARA